MVPILHLVAGGKSSSSGSSRPKSRGPIVPSVITIGRLVTRRAFTLKDTEDDHEGSFDRLQDGGLVPVGYGVEQQSSIKGQKRPIIYHGVELPLETIKVTHDLVWSENKAA